MFSIERCAKNRRQYPRPARGVCAVAAIAMAIAGCSADITRFDGAFGLTETPAAKHASRRASSRPIVTEAPLSNSGGGVTGSYDAPPLASNSRDGGITVSALPNTGAGVSPAPSYAPPSPPAAASPRAVAVPSSSSLAPVAPSRGSGGGRTIEVQAGDTISGLARRHNVSIADLMSINNLRSPAIKPGQQLVLPGGAKPRAPFTREAAAPPSSSASRPAARETATAPSANADQRNWNGTYTVKSGDNLYSIARSVGVKSEELVQANGIADVRKVRPGTILKVPGGVAPDQAASVEVAGASPRAPESPRPSEAPRAQSVDAAAPSGEPARPRIVNGPRVAAVPDPTDAATDAAPPAASVAAASPKAGGPGKLRWPVRGKIVSGFGRSATGTHNDGVNIQAPAGTDVLAAEAGVIAYAGSEVKGYGNLVLVRHDNGWVTAYGHNDSIAVQRGDRVRRGQALGKVGTSGPVDQPQLHFELRQGNKPVDPVPFMERM